MSNSTDQISDKVAEFGVSMPAAKLYAQLLASGPVGVMKIVKQSSLGRNVVYRLLDELENAQLVSVLEKSFGKQYSARGIEAFEAIATARLSEARSLQTNINDIAVGLQLMNPTSKSQIIHFKGPEGLKQVNWNLTKAVNEYRVYEQSHIEDYLPVAFAETLYQTYASKKLTSFDLTNKSLVESYYTEDQLAYWREYSNYRYISPQVLDIQYEMYIYNDVVTLLDYAERGKEHCIEIHNARLAKMQKQIYDAVWSQAQEFTHIDPKTGERRL